MGNQRTGLTSRHPRGEHRGSYSSRYLGCQWRWQPVKARARRGDAVCLHPLSLKSQKADSSARSDQLSEIYSVTSAPSQQGMSHYLQPLHGTDTFPLNATILLWTEIFCVPHYVARQNPTENISFVLIVKGFWKDANIGACLSGLKQYILFSRWILGV